MNRQPRCEPPLHALNPHRGEDQFPDLSQLTISPSARSSVSLESEDLSPFSPHFPPAPLPDVIGSPTRRAAAPRTDTVSVNVLVNGSSVSVAVNSPVRSSARGGTPSRRQPAPAASSPGGVGRSAPPHSTATTPAPHSGPRYTMRAGGKVIAWNPSLEHIEPRDPYHTRKWYVVTAGLRVGIWKSWLAMEDFVDVKGKRFQSYERCEDAEKDYYEAKRDGRVRLLIK